MFSKKTFGFILTFSLAACGSGIKEYPLVTVPLLAQMGSGQSGTAVLTVLTDGSKEYVNVHIDVHGGTDGSSQTAHIHSGTCANQGDVYSTLGIVTGGLKDYAVLTSPQLLTGGHRYIDIHNSDDETKLQVCGNIP